MRFILVQCHPSEDWGIPQWRATCATEVKTTDVFFFATDIAAAKSHIRAKFAGTSFSDESVSHGL